MRRYEKYTKKLAINKKQKLFTLTKKTDRSILEFIYEKIKNAYEEKEINFSPLKGTLDGKHYDYSFEDFKKV